MRRSLHLKNGKFCIFRDICPEDAAEMIAYLQAIAEESDNLTFGRGDLELTVEQEQEIIRKTIEAGTGLWLVAVCDNRIVGGLNLSSSSRPRLAHAGEFGVSVRKHLWGNGIASALIEEMIRQVREEGRIRKINLEVRTDNASAIALYERFGFAAEGINQRAFLVDGSFYDTQRMGLMID